MSAPKVRYHAARTFHKQVLSPWRTVFVKNGYTLVPCEGDAHSSPHIDNCMRCLTGVWGWRLVQDSDPTPSGEPVATSQD